MNAALFHGCSEKQSQKEREEQASEIDERKRVDTKQRGLQAQRLEKQCDKDHLDNVAGKLTKERNKTRTCYI